MESTKDFASSLDRHHFPSKWRSIHTLKRGGRWWWWWEVRKLYYNAIVRHFPAKTASVSKEITIFAIEN